MADNNWQHNMVASKTSFADADNDLYPTPPWCVRALRRKLEIENFGVVSEPAAGRGDIVRAILPHTDCVNASDIKVRENAFVAIAQSDFLSSAYSAPVADWIITNPPYALAEDFVLRAFACAPREGIAFFVRTSFLESRGRFKKIFASNPPRHIYMFASRVRGITKSGFDLSISSMVSYCWLVWRFDGKTETKFDWIDPAWESQLTDDEDYR